MDPKALGKRIRAARENQGLSQDDFALLIERDQRAVSEYENGKRRITVTELPKFAEALHVSILYFFDEDESHSDLDLELLDYFHRLPTLKARLAAIQIMRVLLDTVEKQ